MSAVSSERSRPTDLGTVLALDWEEYLHALHAELCWWQLHWTTGLWPDARLSLDDRQDNSWINAIWRLRRDTQVALADLDAPAEERYGSNVLLGDDDEESNTYFFGNLHAAGTVTKTLRTPSSNPSAERTIDEARLAAQRLSYRHATPQEAVRPWAAIVSLHDFGVASASRLLIGERPDLYFMLNGASRRRMAKIAGHRLPKQLSSHAAHGHYESMLAAVYSAPWWNEAPPADSQENFLWGQRVALLDVFAYSEDDARRNPGGSS